MKYSKLVEVYEDLENTSSKLKKTEIIAEFLEKTNVDELAKITLLVQGKIFPGWSEKEIGIALQTMMKVISSSLGIDASRVEQEFKKTGDLGLVAEKLMGKKKQTTLFKKDLSADKVFENLKKLADIEGKGTQNIKIQIVSELVAHASAKEAKYIVRTTIGDMRIGVAEGIVRDAVAKAFLKDEDWKEAVKAVERAWFVRPDYGEVAQIAKESGLKGLSGVKLEIGKPYHVLLSEKAPSMEKALDSYEKIVVEVKYDGARLCIHKKDEKVWLFTRRLENVTKQFPEVVSWAKTNIKSNNCIIEAEMLGFDGKTKQPLPFQFLSQRIKRKYDIEKIAKDIPVQINIFDITYLDGKVLFNEILEKRLELLKNVVKPIAGKFQLVKGIRTKDIEKVEEFYKKALSDSQEGVMVKNLEAIYQPGRRVAGGWLKVKPTMENLDLAIIGAQWGTGKRTGWLGTLMLGCRDEKSGKFMSCGMIGTGIKEKSSGIEGNIDVTFKQLTKLLKPNIESESGVNLKIRPKVVIEVAYEEIQRSTNYESGFALRFPRVIRLRTLDKSAEQCDTLERIRRLYKMQKGGV
ncbi:MAG: ATP-dependent DNA ligase [Nanoarchaeota archaeon]|nr:ATP-dependent DNA ligase [Nanoarchaeota archaeon]MBU1135757.1 ATP-dependent DNA ligase [Nanoarchaeota archaeon]MBU2520119.1 ATP-dependent DNA ligase [Nanoarchaeota archaeon]